MKLSRIRYYLFRGIWRIDDIPHPTLLNTAINWLRKFILAVLFFIRRNHTDYATALSFSTMLAIVPVVAVVFAIARGFGLDNYITQWINDTLESQPQVAEYIIQLAGSYLEHTKTGVIIGIGLLFMLYSVLSLIYNVEHAFDEIWQVKDRRSALRIITDYTALLFLVPIGIILMSGVNIFVYTIVDELQAFIVLGSLAKWGIKVFPFVLMSCVFIGLYVFMPNTKVKLSKAVVPGIIAGVAMLLLQFFYVNCQIFLTSYNAIYGSFAALPLFMLWMMISWYITLFCAELCYMNQNMDYYAFLIETKDVSHRNQMLMSAALLTLICRRFTEGKKSYTALELKNLTGIPIRVTTDLLFRMRDVNLLTEINGNESDEEPSFQPAQDLQNITVGRMTELLENYPRDKQKRMEESALAVFSAEKRREIAIAYKNYMDALNRIAAKDL